MKGTPRPTKKAPIRPLRFTLDRLSGKPYVSQLSDAIRDAIEGGYYRDGDILPSLDALAATAGVSVIVPREAISRLSDEGLVVPCRGVGSIVRAPKGSRLGHVLLVTAEIADNRFVGAICGTLRRELAIAGYRVSQVSVVEGPGPRHDYAQLDALLGSPVSLVVLLTARNDVGRYVSRFGVPLVLLESDPFDGRGGNVVGRLPSDRFTAVPDFIAHCVAAGVRHVTELVCDKVKPVAVAALRAAGVVADELKCPIVRSYMEGERCIEPQVFDFMRTYCRRHRRRVRDLFFFSDDFAARGALTAFLAEGVRVPEDVQVVTWCVRGDEPLSVVPLTRLETDSYAAGRAYAAFVLGLLRGDADATCRVEWNKYVVGETFPARRRTGMSSNTRKGE